MDRQQQLEAIARMTPDEHRASLAACIAWIRELQQEKAK